MSENTIKPGTMNFSIEEKEKRAILNQLQTANLTFQKTYPGDKPDRQPVHTLYGGANLFKSDTCIRMGEVALETLETYAPNFVVLANVLQLDGHGHLPRMSEEIASLITKMDNSTEEDRKKEPAWLAYSVYN